jgi:hypothetical protein
MEDPLTRSEQDGASAQPILDQEWTTRERATTVCVVSLTYLNSQLRFAGGRFVQYADDEKLAGSALLEMHDGDDRLVLDHGASGAPRARLRWPSRRSRHDTDDPDNEFSVECDTDLDGVEQP